MRHVFQRSEWLPREVQHLNSIRYSGLKIGGRKCCLGMMLSEAGALDVQLDGIDMPQSLHTLPRSCGWMVEYLAAPDQHPIASLAAVALSEMNDGTTQEWADKDLATREAAIIDYLAEHVTDPDGTPYELVFEGELLP